MCYEGGVQWFHPAYHQIGLEKPNVSIQAELDLAEDSAKEAAEDGASSGPLVTLSVDAFPEFKVRGWKMLI